MNDRTRHDDAELALLSGAYALNALSADESAEFELYLSRSLELRTEVTELTDTAVELGNATTPIEPPAALKTSIMEQIARTAQLPSQLQFSDAAAPTQNDVAPGTTSPGTTSPGTTSPGAASPSIAPFGAVPLGAAARAANKRWFQRPLTALVAVAAVAGLVVGGGILSNVVSTSREQSVQADRLAAINAAGDRQEAIAEVSGGGTATLVWSNELLASAVIVDGLAPLPESKVYELWYIGESGPRAAGTFTVGEAGTTWRVLDGDMRAGDVVGVTVEPRDGSGIPTTDPIVAIVSA